MKVYIIGKTGVDLFPARDDSRRVMPGKAEGSAMEGKYRTEGKSFGERERPYVGQALVEFAGRLCYESFDLPNERTKENSGYIRNIIELGHESVLEHVSVTFYVEGVSRPLSHELGRHRHLSFSELSQRYVDMSESSFITPPAFEDGEPHRLKGAHLALDDYEYAESELKRLGVKGKKVREAARYYLPAGMETKFVVTGNLRAWRDVLKKRDSEHADAEMQLFAKEVKRQLLEEYPDVFQDLDGEDK